MFTIDASVYVSALNPTEADSIDSRAFLDLVLIHGEEVVVPTLLRVEVAAALARALSEPRLAVELAEAVSALPGYAWMALDASLAEESAALAAEHRLRGTDAVYAAVARRGGMTLVTRDRQQLERLSGLVPTLTPAAAARWLEERISPSEERSQ
jgi:predicted nucleic acid-binding protein